MRRQLYRGGGITGLYPRQKFGIGSKFQDFKDSAVETVRKIIPNEIADVAVKAAPFVAMIPGQQGTAALMRGLGRLDQRGNLTDALKQGALTYGFGKYVAPTIRQGVGNLYQGLTPTATTPAAARDSYMGMAGKTGPSDQSFLNKVLFGKEGGGVPVFGDKGLIGAGGEFGMKEAFGKGVPAVFAGSTLATLAIQKALGDVGGREPGESLAAFNKRRESTVANYLAYYYKRANKFRIPPEDMDAAAAKFVSDNTTEYRVGENQGGRIGYQTGGITMANTLQENIRRNQAQAASNQSVLQGARNMQRATNILDQASRSQGGLSDLYNQYFHGKGNLGQFGFQRQTADSSMPPNTFTGYTHKDRAQIIKDIAGQLGNQTTYTPAPKPRPKTYRTVSPEAQALNMSQATYEDIIRSGADPKQYYMDYQNRILTGGVDTTNPNYVGPPLLKYGQVIGAPGMMSGIAGPGMGPGATPPTQAQINQMMQNNPAGYADFDALVKQYGSMDPYKSLQEEIMDMVEGRDTGYMNAQDYYDMNVLGLSGQEIAEKYGIAYNQGGRVGLRHGTPEMGIKSLEAGAPDITYEGNEGPQAPMKMADSFLREEYDKYIYDLLEQRPEATPMSFEEFRQMVLAEGQMSKGPILPSPEDPVNPFGPKPQGPVLPEKMMVAQGGRIGYSSGTTTIRDYAKSMNSGRGPITRKDYIDLYLFLGYDEGVASNFGTSHYKYGYHQDPKVRGFAKGGRIGFDEGANTKFAMIKDMLAKGMDIDTIMSITGATQEEIDSVKNKRVEESQGGRIGYRMGMGPAGLPGIPRMAPDGMEFDMRENGGFQGLGAKEKKDDVPAMLAKNEFVFTADAVRGAGGGDIELGAQRMYDAMKNLEKRVV